MRGTGNGSRNAGKTKTGTGTEWTTNLKACLATALQATAELVLYLTTSEETSRGTRTKLATLNIYSFSLCIQLLMSHGAGGIYTEQDISVDTVKTNPL